MAEFLPIIDRDTTLGEGKFYDLVKTGIEAYLTDGKTLPSLGEEGSTQIDIGRFTLTPVRVSFQTVEEDAWITAWGIDETGAANTHFLNYATHVGENGVRSTRVFRSNQGSLDSHEMDAPNEEIAIAFQDIVARAATGNIIVL